jgi:glycosyltransferase involved in cell wall biosynthesis
MRVVMPIIEYHPVTGGAQRQLAALGPLLAQRGVEAHVLTRTVTGEPDSERLHSMQIHRLNTGSRGPLVGPRFVAAAARRIRALDPDVIHAFSLFSPSLIAMRAHRRLGIPTIVKVLRGGEMGERARLLDKPFAARRVARLRVDIDRFAVISREIDAELAALGISKAQRVWLPNGVDVERFRPAGPSERQALRSALRLGDGPVAIYCGRLVPEKDLDLLIAAWSTIRRRHSNAELCIVGTGPEENRLRTAAGDGIRFAGNQSEVDRWLQAADLFVLPSRTEGLSNAMLEAMAVGLPAVVTRVGGAEDVIEQDRNGLLVEPGSRAQLESTLLDCLGDHDRLLRLGLAARKTAVDHYSLEHTADRWVEEYRQLAERSGRRRQ